MSRLKIFNFLQKSLWKPCLSLHMLKHSILDILMLRSTPLKHLNYRYYALWYLPYVCTDSYSCCLRAQVMVPFISLLPQLWISRFRRFWGDCLVCLLVLHFIYVMSQNWSGHECSDDRFIINQVSSVHHFNGVQKMLAFVSGNVHDLSGYLLYIHRISSR